jgi:hypothetical protein
MCNSYGLQKCLINKHPVPTKLTTVDLINVKSRNALLRVLPVCIGSYLQPVLRYKCLILYTYHHPYTQYLCEQGCEDPWLFVEIEMDP